MPVIIFALTRIGLVSRDWLAKRRGYVLIICFVIGAIITPTPDPFNQTLVSVPMYLLFEVGLLLSRFGGRRPGRPAAAFARPAHPGRAARCAPGPPRAQGGDGSRR